MNWANIWAFLAFVFGTLTFATGIYGIVSLDVDGKKGGLYVAILCMIIFLITGSLFVGGKP